MAEQFKVLIAIDSSEHANFAFEYYRKHVHKPDNELILLHVAELPASSIMYMSGTVWEEVVQREKDKSKSLEKEYKDKLDRYQLSAKILVTFGNKPGEMVVKTAEEEGANMIVVGSRGAGKVRRTIMGSVSDYILHHSHCPVVVCRQEAFHHPHRSFFRRKLSSRSDSERSRKNSESERSRKNSESERHRKDSESERHRKDSESERYRKDSEGERHRKDSESERHRKDSENERSRKASENEI